MDVFSAFPKAIITDTWRIGQNSRGTLVGVQFVEYGELDVIVDDGSNATLDNAPNAEGLVSDVLVYAKPSQLPTLNTRALVSSYMLTDGEAYYDIVDAALGKNQETGTVEHVELMLRQTEVADE